MCGGRQSGKTYAIELKLAWECISKPGTMVLYTAMADKQVLFVFREMLKHAFISSHVRKSNVANKEIWFDSGSYIKFASTRIPENLKGIPYDIVVLDEVMDAWTQEGYDLVVPALVAAKRGRIIYSGQPRSTRHWFFSHYIAGIPLGKLDPYSGEVGTGVEEHETIVFPTPKGANFQDAGGLKELALLKASVDALTWERDYLCMWLDISESNAFDPEDVKQCLFDGARREPAKGRLYAIGHDLGETKDRGVSKVLDIANGEVVDSFVAPRGMKHRRPSAETDQVREVYKLARRWNGANVYVDGTGGGSPGTTNDYAKEYLALIPNCHALYFLNNTKDSMVDNLKFSLERKLIAIPSWDKQLVDELLAYQCEIKSDRRVFHGDPHDDQVCALILANEGMRKQRALLGASHFNLGKHVRG